MRYRDQESIGKKQLGTQSIMDIVMFITPADKALQVYICVFGVFRLVCHVIISFYQINKYEDS